MDVQDQVRPGQVQQIRVTGHITRMIAQPLRAVVGLAEPGPLQQRAPRPVQHRDALSQQLTQGLGRSVQV